MSREVIDGCLAQMHAQRERTEATVAGLSEAQFW